MDSDRPPPKGRKPKFVPKAPPRRKAKKTAAQPKQEETDEVKPEQLRKHFQELETLRKKRPKAEDKSPVRPTFSYDNIQSAPIDGNHSNDGGKLALLPSSSSALQSYDSDSDDEYREPWDYAGSYYPTTLPLRKPYSGDPDTLDEAEFGKGANGLEYDEDKINAASELGFLDTNETSENPKLLFFKLPPSLPAVKRAASASASAKGKEKAGASGPPGTPGSSHRNVSLKELPPGLMGKVLVYKSGAIKLKLGDTLYDISPGSESVDCPFTQEVVAVNVKEKECCSVGEFNKSAVVIPDVDNILDTLEKL